MNLDLVIAVLEAPTSTTIQAMLDDGGTVFWVDWREEDDSIPGYCEDILQTGSLSGELMEVDTEQGYEIYVKYRDHRVKVPLTYSPADRHLTIYAINFMLRGEYEIRFCADSAGSDTLAFLPLSTKQWAELETRHSGDVGKRFHKIAAKPNLFTDALSS
jgi:hypothetical protein